MQESPRQWTGFFSRQKARLNKLNEDIAGKKNEIEELKRKRDEMVKHSDMTPAARTRANKATSERRKKKKNLLKASKTSIEEHKKKHEELSEKTDEQVLEHMLQVERERRIKRTTERHAKELEQEQQRINTKKAFYEKRQIFLDTLDKRNEETKEVEGDSEEVKMEKAKTERPSRQRRQRRMRKWTENKKPRTSKQTRMSSCRNGQNGNKNTKHGECTNF